MGRDLREDEKLLWAGVAKGCKKLEPKIVSAGQEAVPRTGMGTTPSRSSQETADIQPFRIGEKVALGVSDPGSAQDLNRRYNRPRMRMDKKLQTKLRKGALSPEARLDLHGMNREQAKMAVTSFVRGSWLSGKRLLLIITGKGRDKDHGDAVPEPVGVLRSALPTWLESPSTAECILDVMQAHVNHGGAGAVYVYLRRKGIAK